MVKLPDCLKNSKCILHIDLDCFFAQVEEVRLGLDSSKPVAVQQWSSLIAVNYAARAAGVSRHCSVDEARRLCPEITLVHVATYAPNSTTAEYHTNPSQATHKVALDAYRNAGKKIFKIFNQHCSLLQKLGSDEAFLDVTDAVNERLCNEYIPAHPVLLDHLDSDGDSTAILNDFTVDWKSINNVVPSMEEKERQELAEANGDADLDILTIQDPTSWFDIQLVIGADIAATIRKQVFDELHYTCSAGISHNKVLAKLGSSRNKPNKQTVIRQHIALQFMENIPFNKIRNLGGKFGQSVEDEYKVDKASDLWQYPLEELQDKFGDSSGLWLYNIVRGIDHEEVILLKAPKSLMASKNIRPAISNQEELAPWYAVLSGELHARVMTNWKEYQSWPKTLSISYRSSNNYNTRSKSTAMLPRRDLDNLEKLQQKIVSLFGEVLDDMFPCILLAVQASGLVPDASITNHTINNFFTTPAQNTTIDTTDKTDTNRNSIGSVPAPSSSSSSSTPHTCTASRPKPSPLQHFFSNQSKRQLNEIDRSIPTDTTTEKKDSSVTHFFTTQTNKSNNTPSSDMIIPSESATITTWTCDQCHKRIPLEQVDQHTDYHFALDLDKQDNGGRTMVTPGDGKRKDRQASSNTNSGKRPKHLFFKPSSS